MEPNGIIADQNRNADTDAEHPRTDRGMKEANASCLFSESSNSEPASKCIADISTIVPTGGTTLPCTDTEPDTEAFGEGGGEENSKGAEQHQQHHINPALKAGDESSRILNGEQEHKFDTKGNTAFDEMLSNSIVETAPVSFPLSNDCDKEALLPSHEEAITPRPVTPVNDKVNNETAAPNPPNHLPRFSSNQKSYSSLVSLPIDSLHSIASFLRPIEWRNFGQCNKPTNKICREIFRRVRMHGFRCATEVVTAWNFGQHADAKELCALYVSAGVPIYPHCLGHSYHTLLWRLSIEAKKIQERQEKQEEVTKNGSPSSTSLRNESKPIDPSASISNVIDQFYNERDDFRMREELIDGLGESGITYLEEKSLYKLNSKSNQSGVSSFPRPNWRRVSVNEARLRERNPHNGELPHAPRIPHPLPFGAADAPLARNHWVSMNGVDHSTVHRRALLRSNSFTCNRYRAPKVSLKIHRHLLDQHLLGRPGVNDFDGSMTTPQVSLSADFFHPFFSFRSNDEAARNETGDAQNPASIATESNSLLPAYRPLPLATNHARRIDPRSSNAGDDSDSDVETEVAFSRQLVMQPPHLDEMMAAGANLLPPAMVPPIPPTAPTASMHSNRSLAFHSSGIIPELLHSTSHEVANHGDILSNIDLDVYSASSRSIKSDDDATEQHMNKYLRARFTVYHCCLERHLLNNDSHGFDETIMDFWDEFFPQTTNIQYYDKHTAVPRISRLETFLTTPCPKQIGIVQCEIERVKLSSKKKGVNMKGRFFPTYEYRLFIRHRPTEPTSDFIDNTNKNNDHRRDTVLMMAKNRGRKFPDNIGQASKKGSNNYYLSLPQQEDLNLHYKSVNDLDDLLENSLNGIGKQSSASKFSGLLGRLQSNFVGTEFQIFTPRETMKKTKSEFLTANTFHNNSSGFSSEDDITYGRGRERERYSVSSRSRSRFGRLSLKGRNGNTCEDGIELSEPLRPRSSPLALRRSRSSDATRGRNRKVSAAESFFESQHFKTETQHSFFEEEDGAITYTANLLGSRPRIMDVCIPKVNADGKGTEWIRYLENSKHQDAGSVDHLLNYLKQLQANNDMEFMERAITPTTGDTDEPGIGEGEHSAPSDCGLLALQNRPPWWNVELGSFVLNFGGRVSVASVKNFQLCDRDDQDHIMLQFGRIEGRHSFTMDFQYPLTAVQAFAIAISSLQSKISFG